MASTQKPRLGGVFCDIYLVGEPHDSAKLFMGQVIQLSRE